MSRPRSEVYLQPVHTLPNMKVVVLAISVAGMAPLMPGSQTMDVSSWASGSYLLSVQPEHGQRHATLLHVQH